MSLWVQQLGFLYGLRYISRGVYFHAVLLRYAPLIHFFKVYYRGNKVKDLFPVTLRIYRHWASLLVHSVQGELHGKNYNLWSNHMLSTERTEVGNMSQLRTKLLLALVPGNRQGAEVSKERSL